MMLIMMSMAHRTAKFCVSSDSMLAVSVEATDLLVVISLLLISYSHAASTHSLPEGMDDLLCLTFAFWDNDVADNVIYQKLLRDKLSSDLLRCSGHRGIGCSTTHGRQKAASTIMR